LLARLLFVSLRSLARLPFIHFPQTHKSDHLLILNYHQRGRLAGWIAAAAMDGWMDGWKNKLLH